MKQEIVLPKFKIPGQTNWLVRGLWIGGGVVVLLTVLVVLGLAKQKGEQEAAAQRLQAEQQAAAAAAATAAQAPAPKPVRAASKTLATKAPLTQAALETGKPGALAKPRAGLGGKTKARARAGYRKKPARQSKLFATKAAAKSGARPAAAKAPAAKAGKGDAIDDILRNFK
jgi:hypothetical protein